MRAQSESYEARKFMLSTTYLVQTAPTVPFGHGHVSSLSEMGLQCCGTVVCLDQA